ncbi:MAG: tRNA pseudouridine(38-40) synthase TruA, partial [Gammaproteobacteria bacterium]|nr:tRNA pseudouridine(38-40) synthase TruA [Gammaproteobacteria bacterium]
MAEQHYRVVIAYKGRDYFGWQYLGDAGEKPTVQFEILKALRKISKYETCQV